MMQTTRFLAAFMAAGLVTGIASAQSSRIQSTQGDNVNVRPGQQPGSGGGEPDWDNLPVSRRTIEMNQYLYEIRDQIAALATWHGPGPHNIHELRAPAGPNAQAAGPSTRADAPGGGIDRPAGVAGGTGHSAMPGSIVRDPGGIDPRHDNRALARFNLWPGGEIPYTFSDEMIEAFFFTPDPDPAQFNAARGVASALAVMIIMEQETPIRFVGYDPVQHVPGSILIWDSFSDGWDGPEDGPPPPFEIDELTAGTDNQLLRIGRSPQPSNPDIDPTRIFHGYWQNFPSLVRTLGFVFGLDWEQRHPNRNTYIQVHPENIPPAFGPDGLGWPRRVSGGGNITPGFPLIFEEFDAGQQLFAINTTDEGIFPVGDFDLDSIMLINHMDYNNTLPMYTIRDEYRYRDLNGDGIIDTTPFGPDDLMWSRPSPTFFSDGDIAAIEQLYANNTDPCPADMNGDGIVSDLDVQLYLEWWHARDIRAELTGDICIDIEGNGIADNDCIDIADLVMFFVLMQQSTECGNTVIIGGANTIQPI